jgi:hemerythrin-like domain-containing protein
MLSDCHRRIEKFLNVLISVAAEGGELNEDRRAGLDTALLYFRQSAPKHTRDEEDSLFPRMLAHPQAQMLIARLDALQSDHATADAAHSEVDSLGREWLAKGRLDEEAAQCLRESLDKLRSIYERHIAEEDNEIFPLAAKVLGRDEIESIAREMASRRLVELDERMMPAHWPSSRE